jgi:hypothetical protein
LKTGGILYDGGTDFTSLKCSRSYERETDLVDFYLLFSDGFETMGVNFLPKVMEVPVYCFSNSASVDAA